MPDGLLAYDPMGLIVFVISLALAPFISMMVTSFIKLVVVMNLIRQAMGLQQIPPNMVVNGLAMVLTFYLMAPTIQTTVHRAFEAYEVFKTRKELKDAFVLPDKFKPYQSQSNSQDLQWLNGLAADKEKTDADASLEKLEQTKTLLAYVKEPMSDFLVKHSTVKQKQFFMRMANRLWPESFRKDVKESDLLICIPSFTLSELTASFEIGFLIYLPFIAIDLVVSNILLAMGMMMVSPMTISLPFKLMLFVLVNGWSRLVEALLLTY